MGYDGCCMREWVLGGEAHAVSEQNNPSPNNLGPLSMERLNRPPCVFSFALYYAISPGIVGKLKTHLSPSPPPSNPVVVMSLG